MCIGLLALMGYQRIGADVHEWLGFLETILFAVHLILNRQWLMHLTKGKYTWFRILQMSIFISMLICFSIQILSGIVLSKSIFTFLQMQGMTSFARQCHMVVAYWGFVLLSLHIGLHVPLLTMKFKDVSKNLYRLFLVIICIMSCYGGYALLRRDILLYMFQRIQFAYFDFKESLLFFYFDYSCILIFLAISMYLIVKVIRKNKKGSNIDRETYSRKDEINENETIRS